jgi:RNA polymerase sigma-70 factor (ECF subfamily)
MNPASSSDAARLDAFEPHRKRLWGLAYRMLGSSTDAEDMVQEAWLRWCRAPVDEIRTSEAWLVRAMTRLCIDRLRQRRAERVNYVGPWLPEPLVDESALPPDQSSELASDLSVAFLALLERLAPDERAAFLLHEVFDSGYGDIAQILGKSESTCRQIVSRARKRVRDGKPRVQVSSEARQRLLGGLVSAIQQQDMGALIKLLSKDAAWTSDGGGKTKAARKVVRGAEHVARFATGVYHRYLADLEFRLVTVNDEAGIEVLYTGRPIAVLTIRTDGRRILDVYAILNPDKLQGLKAVTAPMFVSSDGS